MQTHKFAHNSEFCVIFFYFHIKIRKSQFGDAHIQRKMIADWVSNSNPGQGNQLNLIKYSISFDWISNEWSY